MSAPSRYFRLTLAAVAALFAAMAVPDASAQQVVVMVNGEPITSRDVEQRTKFLQLSTQKTPSRQEVLDELINEKLKIGEAKRFRIEVSDSEVDSAYANMASRGGGNVENFNRMFANAGISPATLKSRLRADMAWGQLVRGRFQSSLQVGEKDIVTALETKKPGEKDAIGYEYKLRPILFIVTRGSAATMEGRRKEAEALRARFQNCDEGIALARSLRDVAVRTQISRSSADLPAPLREVLESTPVGKLTPPENTRQGVEVFALCGKTETRVDTPGRRQVQNEMYSSRYEAQAKSYLERVRKSSMIEYR